MLREDIVTNEVQHDLDNLGHRQDGARREDPGARRQDEAGRGERAHGEAVSRARAAGEAGSRTGAASSSLAPGCRSPPRRRWKSRKKSAASATKLSSLLNKLPPVRNFRAGGFVFGLLDHRNEADSMMRWSAVSRRRRWTRAVATITRSPGSRRESPMAATSMAISVVRGMSRNAGLVSNSWNSSFNLALSRCSSLGQERNFKQADGTDAEALAGPHSVLEHSALLARQFLGFGEPTDHDVGIEQKSRIQLLRSSSAPQSIPKFRGIEIDDVSGDLRPSLPRIPAGDFHTGFFAAETVATGRPRLVTVIVPPCSVDLVEQCEALGLELGRADDHGSSCFHHTSNQCGHLTSSPARPQALSGVVAPIQRVHLERHFPAPALPRPSSRRTNRPRTCRSAADARPRWAARRSVTPSRSAWIN